MYSIDSRTIQTGDIYIPIKGPNFDGHDFIDDVLQKGASKVLDVPLTDYATYFREKNVTAKIIGITGSAGKTTVKDLLTQVLRTQFNVHKTLENQNNQVGVPLTLLNAAPDDDYIVVEMAMRARGEILELANIAKPDYVLISSVGSTHIELLKTRRNIALAKAEIFQFRKMSEQKCYTCLNKSLSYYDLLSTIAKKNNFTVETIDATDPLESNYLMIEKLALHLGISQSNIDHVFKNYKSQSAHRQQILEWQNTVIIDDTYNANPESMLWAIKKATKDYPVRRLVVILGEMRELGKEESKEHLRLLEFVDNNENILKGYFLGNIYKKFEKKTQKCYYFLGKAELVSDLQKLASHDYVLLFKASRGIKLEEAIEALIHHT